MRNKKSMSTTMELTQENLNRAHRFALYLLLHVGPFIDEMQPTCNEAVLGCAFLLGESLSHRDKKLRQILAAQWHGHAIQTAEDIAAARQRRRVP